MMANSDFYFALVLSLLCLISLVLVLIASWIIRSRTIGYVVLRSKQHYVFPTTISIIALVFIYRANLTIRQSQAAKPDQIPTGAPDSELVTGTPDSGRSEGLIILENKFLAGQLSHFPEQSENQEPNRAACRHVLRIVNVGLAQESIVSYDAVVEYGDQRVAIKSTTGGAVTTRDKLTESIGEFYTIFPGDESSSKDSNFRISPYAKSSMVFPIHVKSSSVVNIIAELGFKAAEGVYDFETPEAFREENDKVLMISYVLYTTSGEQMSSMASPCWLLRERSER